MTKIFFVLILTTLFSSCGQGQQEDPSNDYVLIEFASKLEEEYDKLEPNQNKQKQTSTVHSF